MRKTTFLKSVLVAIVLLTSSVSTWADTYTHTFTAKVWSAYDTQTLSGVSWTAAATSGTYWNYDGTKGHQFGSASNAASALSLSTTGITGTITSVKVNTSGASSIVGTFGVSVGGTAFTNGSATSQALTSTATTYTFTGSGSGNVVLSWSQTSSKALYIKSIEITYSNVITAVPVITAASPAGTVGSALSYNISATNSPTSYTLASGTLPTGLSLNTTTGAITGTPTAAGNTSVTVTATNSIGTSAPATLSFSIAKGNQTITFGVLDAKTSADAAFGLSATASSGLTVSYTSSNLAVATVSGATVTITGAGTTTITASQSGNDNYNAATAIDQTLTVNQYVAPTITVTEITIPEFTAYAGSSSNKTLNINGVNLTSDVTLTLSGANANQFTLSQSSVAQTAGTAPITVITVTYNPTSIGTHSATLTLSAAGAYDIAQSFSGTATWAPLSAPVATNATSQTGSEFTANWNAVEGATEYQLDVYSETAGTGGTTSVLAENFNNFSAGTTGSTADATDIATTIDTYTQTTGWTGTKVYQAGGATKIGTSSALGSITTPTIDLSGKSGAFNVSFKSMAWSGDSTKVKIYLNDALVKTVSGLTNDATYALKSFSVDLTGGTTTSKLRFEGNQAAKGRFFLEDLAISQTGSSTVQTPLSGSPFAVTGTSKVVTGLAPGTIYKYTVIAKNANVTSEKSNAITVDTVATGIYNPQTSANVTVSNGNIKFPATAGEKIEIFNCIGQKLIERKATEGINSISVSVHGVILVKVGNRIAKVIL